MNQNEMGNFLRQLRKEKKLTQEELAEKLYVSNRSISRWENGNTIPDFSLLVALSKIYEVSVEELIDGKRKSMEKVSVMDKVANYTSNEKTNIKKRFGFLFLFLAIVLPIALVTSNSDIRDYIIGMSEGVVIVLALDSFGLLNGIKSYKKRMFRKEDK